MKKKQGSLMDVCICDSQSCQQPKQLKEITWLLDCWYNVGNLWFHVWNLII